MRESILDILLVSINCAANVLKVNHIPCLAGTIHTPNVIAYRKKTVVNDIFFFRVSNKYLLHAYNSMEPYTFCHA